MKLVHATIDDIPALKQIFNEARQFQRKQGFRQWDDNYPPTETILNDISLNQAYILTIDGRPAAYTCIAIGDDEYERLGYIWKINRPYAAFHRIAIADEFRGKGISKTLFNLLEMRTKELGLDLVRIETGLKNVVMQHILKKREYTDLGIHVFSWGERRAFEKLLSSDDNS